MLTLSSENDISLIPEWIGNLVNLEHLRLADNNISEVPESIRNLADLKLLRLRRNSFTKEYKDYVRSFIDEKVLYI